LPPFQGRKSLLWGCSFRSKGRLQKPHVAVVQCDRKVTNISALTEHFELGERYTIYVVMDKAEPKLTLPVISLTLAQPTDILLAS
jgi:hypothetical protein